MTWATGPDSRVPTKLPAIAAAVHTGNRRFACRASNTDPAIVQAIVTPTAPMVYTLSHAIGTVAG